MNEPNRKRNRCNGAIYKNGSKWSFEYETYAESGEVNVDGKKQNVGEGWVPHGGIKLFNVHHDGHRLAYDIGIVGIIVFPGKKSHENGHKPKYLTLGPPDFIQIDAQKTLLKGSESFNPLVTTSRQPKFDGLPNNMVVYNSDVEFELKVEWVSKYPLFGKESGVLFVTQKIFFTKYDDHPAHEPTGGLMASRIHPLIELKYEHADEDWVDSFRVDYRFYVNLNRWHSIKMVESKQPWPPSPYSYIPPKTVASMESTPGKLPNVAGLFRDEDKRNALRDMAFGVAEYIFKATEKVCVAEVITGGLNNPGRSFEWDNIHWWGAGSNFRAGSAPGSFHSFHLHWRWAAELMMPKDAFLTQPEHAGERQFIGEGFGGTLVDPRIDLQELRIAVVENKGLPDDIHLHRTDVFSDYFISLRKNGVPFEIDRGGDLVLYYSVNIVLKRRSTDAKHNLSKIMEGTVFVHGLFFAHGEELGQSKTGNVGNKYLNPSKPDKQKWFRYPTK